MDRTGFRAGWTRGRALGYFGRGVDLAREGRFPSAGLGRFLIPRSSLTKTRSRAPRIGLAAIATLMMLTLILWPKAWLPRSEQGPMLLPHVDKLIHFSLFSICSLLWLVAGGRRLAPLVFAIGLLLAVGTEFLQGLPMIQRDPDPLDALADICGLVVSFGLWWPFRERERGAEKGEAPVMVEVARAGR